MAFAHGAASQILRTKTVNNLPNIVSFSGGLSSGKMLADLIAANPDFRERFIVVFENTGKDEEDVACSCAIGGYREAKADVQLDFEMST